MSTSTFRGRPSASLHRPRRSLFLLLTARGAGITVHTGGIGHSCHKGDACGQAGERIPTASPGLREFLEVMP